MGNQKRINDLEDLNTIPFPAWGGGCYQQIGDLIEVIYDQPMSTHHVDHTSQNQIPEDAVAYRTTKQIQKGHDISFKIKFYGLNEDNQNEN